MALPEMQALAMSEAPEVGESFLVEVNRKDKNRVIPLSYQILESEQLNNTLDFPLHTLGPVGVPVGNFIRRGIEFDPHHRPVAYHFWSEHPYDYMISAYKTIRIPAERVIHYYERKRPSQYRGVTWFAPILQYMRDLSCYVGDEMSAARIGAQFTVAIKRATGVGAGLGFGDGDYDEDRDGNPLEHLGPGIIANIGKDDDIVQINPNRPNSASEPWIKLILGSMANGIGMTYLGLTGDVEKANFSSARFARLSDKTFWRTLQGRFGRKVVLRIRRRAVEQLIALGRIPALSASQFLANRHRWLATRVLPPGWEEVQVQQEVTAAIDRIRAGLSTLQEECAGRGKNWRRNLMQRAR